MQTDLRGRDLISLSDFTIDEIDYDPRYIWD